MELPFAKQKAASPRGWNFTLLLRQRGNFTLLGRQATAFFQVKGMV
jgi:hypothetical protein